MSRRTLAALLAVAFLASACAGESPPSEGGGSSTELNAEVASFDLAAGLPGRFLVGVGLVDQQGHQFVSGGSVELAFSFLGEGEATGSEPYRDATATFLPIPGSTGPFESQPVAGTDAHQRGIYSVDTFEFDRAGFWEVEVTADVRDHGSLSATAAFEVLPEPLVPVPGDEAPEVENLTIDSADAPEAAIDSRASTGEIPDPELHATTVAESIRSGRPVLVAIATPVYCVSRFCGPVTDMVQELAGEYGDRADFIHIEVWRDYEGGVINKAAADWIYRKKNLLEPWVFLVGADGRVVARWDNVATRQEIEPLLQDLPPLRG